MNLPNGIGLFETTILISQESDSNDKNNLGQEMVLKTVDAGAGKYLIIETARWAIEDEKGIDAFANILKQFLKENE